MTSELKARALFDFLAEGPSELNLTAGEIVIITSGTSENDWWYAQNSSGQSGAVPASYVELIQDESPQTNSQPVPINQSNKPMDNDYTPDSSFDSLSSPTINHHLTDSTMNSFDTYKTDPLTSNPEQQNSLPSDMMLASTEVKTDSTELAPNDNSSVRSNSSANKSEKSKLFSSKRDKPEKRRGSVENGLDPSKVDSDSDGPTDSSYSPANTLSTSNKNLSGGGDSKTSSRARFFDKHGVGNYLIHECKTKPDEHVEITFDQSEGGVCWSTNPNIPPFTCKIENPSRESKFSGLKTFVEYKIHPQIPGSKVVGRRYKQFDWLHEQLAIKYRFICVPPLPGKQIAGRFEQEFIEERRRQLESWLNRICRHPVLCASFPVQHFITCELTEKNNKDWKAGKRKIEKDEFRESSWLYCVTLSDSRLSEAEIATQIDAFAQQQPGLELHLKNLYQGFLKYLERHTEVYEHDVQRTGELFTKLHAIAETDTTSTGSDDLTNSMSKISTSYSGIAELYKTKGFDTVRSFIEHMQDHIGLIGCFPIIISIQRSATEFIRNAQQRGSAATPDLNGAIHRNQILNHVVLAEINCFQSEKVDDLKSCLKSFLERQIDFYEKITSDLRDSLSTLN